MLALKTDLKTPELETRLIEFAVMNLKIARKLRRAFDQRSLSRRLIRASASAALTYGDLPYAGSSLDFIVTMNSVLKELREACAFLNMIRRQNYMEFDRVDYVYQEGKQLIVLFMRNLEEQGH
ncbi:MAG: four helix bundle protein [Cyclobacteriaceae bacterium]|nr:four helix bundle protein [Cyclobacteriaceae bacterium]